MFSQASRVTIIIPRYVACPTFRQCQKAFFKKLPFFLFSDIERKQSINGTNKEIGMSSTETKAQEQTNDDKAPPKSQQGKSL